MTCSRECAARRTIDRACTATRASVSPRIYPELFTLPIVCHWSTGIFHDNHRTQQLALHFYLRFIELNEDQLQSDTIWPYLIQLYGAIFSVGTGERLVHCSVQVPARSRPMTNRLLSIVDARERRDDSVFNSRD
jgi:hypothetical protein